MAGPNGTTGADCTSTGSDLRLRASAGQLNVILSGSCALACVLLLAHRTTLLPHDCRRADAYHRAATKRAHRAVRALADGVLVRHAGHAHCTDLPARARTARHSGRRTRYP